MSTTGENEPSRSPDSPNSIWVSQKTLFRITLTGVILMTAYFSLPFFDKSVYTEDDLIAYYLPMRAFYQDCLVAGEKFDWLPNIGMGIYIHGEGENGFYHPLHLVLYRFLPLHLAFNIDFIWPYLFLLPGTYLFARRLKILPFAALFGATIFTYCGFFMSHYIHMNMLAAASHIPWLLLAINILLTTKKPRTVLYATIAITLLTASQFLHGFPQAMYWSMMAEIAYALYLWPSAQHITRYLHITWAKMLAVLLGAIQWLPTKDVLDLSFRAETSREAAMAESIHPLNIFQFISPYLFHQRTFGPISWDAVYIGSMTLILTAWLLIRLRHLDKTRRMTIGLMFTAIATFCFSLGDHGHMYGWKMYIPVVNGFHSPCRLIILTHLALSLCAALAIRSGPLILDSGLSVSP